MMINILHLMWLLPVTGAICFTIAAMIASGRER